MQIKMQILEQPQYIISPLIRAISIASFRVLVSRVAFNEQVFQVATVLHSEMHSKLSSGITLDLSVRLLILCVPVDACLVIFSSEHYVCDRHTVLGSEYYIS